MRSKTILFILLSVMSFSNCFSQKEWSNWYYNHDNLLTFKNGYPEIVNDIVAVPAPGDYLNFYYFGQGGISYSDPATGEMKFIISNGFGFNKNYDLFSETSLRSCPTNYPNSYHILPFHNDPNKFYVIQFQDIYADLLQQSSGLQVRCPNAIGLGYSIVDLSLNGGLGDFSVMNQVITTGITGQMTTVRHSNGQDVWVIVHPYNTNTFYAYLFTDAGFQPAVVSAIGPTVSDMAHAEGTLTATHDGKLLAGVGASNGVELYDFDNGSGILSNFRVLPSKELGAKLQFSPDNSKLYYLSNNNGIYQYDFNAPNVGASLTKVFENPYSYMYNMQLATDGKIYVTKTYKIEDHTEYTGAIECPNLPQYACNFNPTALQTVQVAFPDLINDFINDPKAPAITKLNLGNDTAICFGELKITAPPGWQSYRWNTGETTSEIIVKKPGIYYVLAGSRGFSCPEGYGSINVADKAIKLDLGPDTTLCPKTPYTLHINSDYSDILWGNGSHTKDSIVTSGNSFIVSANDHNGCFTNDTISVNYFYNPRADFGPDTTLCDKQSLVLQLEPQPFFGQIGVFLWQDGSQNDSYKVTEPGLYWGQSTYENCTVRDTIRVSYVNGANVFLGNDTTLCEGASLLLQVNTSGATNTWSTGETAPSVLIKQSGDYWVRVDNGSCTVADTIKLTFHPKPTLFLGNDTTVCENEKVILRASVPNSSYVWQDQSTEDTFEASEPGLYWAQVTLDGCIVRDSIVVNQKPVPVLNLGNDTSLCVNQKLILNSGASAASYTWQDNANQSTYEVTQAGLYFVKVRGVNGCSNADSINVSVAPPPVFSLGKDTALCETETLLLTANLANAHYLWNTGNNSNSILISQAGIYWLEAVQNGCAKTDSILISYKPRPKFDLGNDTTLCEGNSLLLNVAGAGSTYEWQDHSNGPAQMVTTAGLYTVQVNLNSCKKSDSIVVRYLYKPQFTLGNDTSICNGQSFNLRTSLTNVSYEWQDGSTLPYFTVSRPGVYQLTATNICGSTMDQITIIKGLCELYMPNAFTPNRDGLNDIFKVKYPEFIKTFEMNIYNRFGQVIFKTNNPKTGWDGTFKGLDQPMGTYLWDIRLTNLDNVGKFAKGTINLVR